MKRILFLLTALFPAISYCGSVDFPDAKHFYGVDLHIGRIGISHNQAVNPAPAHVAPAPAGGFNIPGGPIANHKVYGHVNLHAGVMFNDYFGIEGGKTFSKKKFHKRSKVNSRINSMYIGPLFEYKIKEVEGLSLLGSAAWSHFNGKFNEATHKKAGLRLTGAGKYMLNDAFGVRAGVIFHQTSKLKSAKHTVDNSVHYMTGVTCHF